MNKVICDVCGTAYPETATQCPICGSAKTGDDQTHADEVSQVKEDATYTYVPGGRFSKQNVRRRSKGNTRRNPIKKESSQSDEEDQQTNMGLVIVVIALLVAIIAVVIYIGVRFFAPADAQPTGTSPSVTQAPTQGQTELKIPCTTLEISNKNIEFLSAGDSWPLKVEFAPLNTTDTVVCQSSDESVVKIEPAGDKYSIVAVGGGEAVITVTCGSITKECKVICSFASTQEPTQGQQEPTGTTGDVDEDFVFAFDTPYKDDTTGFSDTTLLKAGEMWRAYKSSMTISPTLITWTSDNPAIAKIENGFVTAVAPGTTKVHAQYGGKTYTCIVRCSFKASSSTTEETKPNDGTYHLSPDGGDMTIKVGEYWWVKVLDSNNTAMNVTWKADHEGYVQIEGNKITGVKSTSDLKLKYITVSCTYEGETYSCIVRVKTA